MPVHVELSNPAEDADELEVVLRAAGFQVRRVALTELGRHGSASVVDVSQTGAEAAIETLLTHGSHPVVRVGGPAGQDGVIARPVGHDALLVALRRALAHASQAKTADHIATVTQNVGRTFAPGIELATVGGALGLPEDEAPETRPSQALEEALRQEGGAALVLALSTGQRDGPIDLAPDVLFDFPHGPGDGPEREHELSVLERALPDFSASAPQPVAEPKPGGQVPEGEVNPREGWLGLDDSTLGSPDPTGSFRTGQTTPLGMVRLLWRIAELGLDLELDASFEGKRLLVRFLAGGVRELRGAAHLHFARSLDPPLSAETEREATALLDDAMVRGDLSRFEVDRGVRLAGEELFTGLALASKATFTLRPLLGKDVRSLAESSAPPLARPALVLITLAARAQLGVEALERIAGGAPCMRLSPEARGRLQQAEVEPEVRATVLRHDGGPYRELLREVGEEVGMAGLLCVLAVLDGVHFVGEGGLAS